MEPVPRRCTMAITIRDIAAKSGVGVGTVSRVLNGSPKVLEETRQRILRTIAELNYVPSATARGLSRGKMMTIAVVVPYFTSPAFVERLRGIEQVTAESEYDLVIYNVETSSKRDQYFTSVPDPKRFDGVIIISLPPREEDLGLFASDMPIVFIDVNGSEYTALNRIIIDDVRGAYMATDHLLSLGHRRIGFLGDTPRTSFLFTSGRDRYQGYRKALEEAGVPLHPEYHLYGEYHSDVARDLARRMLSMGEPPTAIFASSDTHAIGVLEVAAELGLNVPGDLSLVGYDDIEIANFLGLTTVRQLLTESGKRGAELLLRLIGSPVDTPVHEVLPIELVVRKTTAPPRR